MGFVTEIMNMYFETTLGNIKLKHDNSLRL